jgi:hypothetical protein
VLPRRLGARFALEALFLVLLAVGAGVAHLRPLYIVGVMAAAWVLVALAEITAGRIDRSPLSYVRPEPLAEEDDEPQRVFGPRPEERTIVAPLEPEAEEEAAAVEPVGEDTESGLEPEADPEGEPEAGRSKPRRLRSLLRRNEPEPEPAEPAAPRHVKLLPRRIAPESSRASQEVSELFGEREEAAKPEETGT